jgi:RHS repeat-associated protein
VPTTTVVVDPNGNTRALTFDANFLTLTDDKAVGTPLEIDTAYCRGGDINVAACPSNSALPAGYLADFIDGVGRDTHYGYDANGNVTSVTYLYGTSSATAYSYTYSPTYNLVTSVTDPLGHTKTTTRPEPLEEASAVADSLGNITAFTYNPQGQVSTRTDALSNVTTIGYDHGDIASVIDPLNRISTLYTDAIGRVSRVIDSLGNASNTVWDPIDGVHQTSDPNGATSTVNFDPDGQTSSIVDALTHTTAYAYTVRDQLLTRTDPNNLQDQFTKYDPDGNPLNATDRKGQKAVYTYDALNRISTATYADSSVVSYTWDKANRLTQIADSAGNTISRFYDGLNNVLCETPSGVSSCVATATNTLTYTYDAASRRATMTVVGQPQVTYTFDNANRLTNIVQGSSSIIKTYDNDNRPATLTYPNGMLATYAFDAASQLVGITYTKGSTTLGTLTYQYDNDGRVAVRGGTLFQSVLPSAMAGAAFDPDNRLCAWNSATASCSSPTITWDANGNLLNDGTLKYTWNARNRLKTTSSGGAYTYDAEGRRLTIGASGGTSFTYDFLNVVQEQQAGAVSSNFLVGLGIDEKFSTTVVSSSVSTDYVTDALGSTVGMANSAASKVVTNYAYDPFGVTTASGNANPQTFKFTGREADGTGLYYNRARYYKPTWGMFISEDPTGFREGLNLYRYAKNNPLNYRDPSGDISVRQIGLYALLCQNLAALGVSTSACYQPPPEFHGNEVVVENPEVEPPEMEGAEMPEAKEDGGPPGPPPSQSPPEGPVKQNIPQADPAPAPAADPGQVEAPDPAPSSAPVPDPDQNGAPSPAPAPAPEPSGPSVPAPTPGQTAGVAGLLLLITAVALSPLGV